MDVVLLCIGDCCAVPLVERRRRAPVGQLGQRVLIRFGQLGSGAHHLCQPQAAEIEELPIRHPPPDLEQLA